MYAKPKEACKYYKVCDQTLRTWANTGKIKFITTEGGHRRYKLGSNEIQAPSQESGKEPEDLKIIYSRVSSGKQRDDLGRQTEFLRERFPAHRVISDVGSGINFKRKGFKRILEGVFKGNIKEVVVAKRDRFTRFGFELFEWIFQQHGAQLICVETEDEEPENELTEDLMSIITVFSARYYGKRKYRKKIQTNL